MQHIASASAKTSNGEPLRALFVTYGMYAAPLIGPAMIGALKRCLRLITHLPPGQVDCHLVHSGAIPGTDPLVREILPMIPRYSLKGQPADPPRGGGLTGSIRFRHRLKDAADALYWLPGFNTLRTVLEQGVPQVDMARRLRKLYDRLQPDIVVLGDNPLAGLLRRASQVAGERNIPQVGIDDYLSPAQVVQLTRSAPLVREWFLVGLPFDGKLGRISDRLVVAPPLLPEDPGTQEQQVDVTILGYDPQVARVGLEFLSRLPPATTGRLIAAELSTRQRAHYRRLAGNADVTFSSLPSEAAFRSYLRASGLVICKNGFQQIVETLGLGTPVITIAVVGGVPEIFMADALRPFVHFLPPRPGDWDASLAVAKGWLAAAPAIPWIREIGNIRHPAKYASEQFAAFLRHTMEGHHSRRQRTPVRGDPEGARSNLQPSEDREPLPRRYRVRTMKPGILSGEPAFPQPVHLIQPTLPAVDEISDQLNQALNRGELTNNGRNVRRLENLFEEYLETHCVCVASGTLGLYLVSLCMKDHPKVLVPAYTFPATGLAFRMRSSELVLGEVSEDTWCLDLDSSDAAELDGIDCIVPVNIYGNPPDVGRIEEFAKPAGCLVVYDSAQGLGSEYQGTRVGRFGTAEIFSLHTTKILSCGEGGVISTTNESLARELKERRNFGLRRQVSCSMGINAKMQEFSAILGIWGLSRLESWIGRRARLAATYRDQLRNVPGIRLQAVDPENRSTHLYFAILIDEDFGLPRDEVIRALAADNILTRAYFSPELAGHPSLAGASSPWGGRRLDQAKEISRKVICLPIYSHQKEDEVRRICDCLKNIYDYRHQIGDGSGAAPLAPHRDQKAPEDGS